MVELQLRQGNSTSTTLESEFDRIMKELAKREEVLLREAVSNHLGRSDWLFSEIINKGELILHPNKVRSFFFEGHHLLDFIKYEVLSASELGSSKGAITLYYRLFNETNKGDILEHTSTY